MREAIFDLMHTLYSYLLESRPGQQGAGGLSDDNNNCGAGCRALIGLGGGCGYVGQSGEVSAHSGAAHGGRVCVRGVGQSPPQSAR